MKRSCVTSAVTLVLFALSASYSLALSPEESFRDNFPGTPFDTIQPTVIAGIYEVVSGNNIFYYAPDAESLIFGQIIKKDGMNITEEKKKSVLAGKVKALLIDQAVKVGNGRQTVIEITDPDCPYCRKAYSYFKERKDVTLYVFFLPLPMHREAEGKVRHILCAKDKEAAYNDVMSGKLDGKPSTPCPDGSGEQLFKIHREAVQKTGLNSVPFFFINGQAVSGADIPAIEHVLGQKKQ
jgi:thiol:disulfide interchange protein DsbC